MARRTESGAVGSPEALDALRWSLVDGVGAKTYARLIEHFGSAAAAWEASARSLTSINGISAAKADRIASLRPKIELQRELDAICAAGVTLSCAADEDFPIGLSRLPDAPIVLYVRGSLEPTDAVAIAIVGTRHCSIYGREQTQRFGEALAELGLTVVSGLARGVDSFAHRGALNVHGRTLAIIGTGLDQIYPPEHLDLADEISEHGAVISELPMSTAPKRENFPARNRLIAGLTLGTLVIEAPQRSGALITARLASEYNREVFAIPGRINEPAAHGANALIRDSAAKLVMTAEDVLSELGDTGAILRPEVDEAAESDAASGEMLWNRPLLSPAEEAVVGALHGSALEQDVLLRTVDFPVGDVLAAVTMLELKRMVRRDGLSLTLSPTGTQAGGSG